MKKTLLMLALVAGPVHALDTLDDEVLAKQDVPVPAKRAAPVQSTPDDTTLQQTLPDVLNKELPVGGIRLDPPEPPRTAEQVWN